MIVRKLNTQFHATAHLNPLAMKTTTGDGKEVIERFRYSNDAVSSPLYGYKRIYNNDSTMTACSYSGQKPLIASTWNDKLQAYEDRLCYTYDSYGNVSSVTTDGRTYTCYLWSYCNQYPIAKIVNVTYDALLSALGKDKAWVELARKYDISRYRNGDDQLAQAETSRSAGIYLYAPHFGRSNLDHRTRRNDDFISSTIHWDVSSVPIF